MRPVFFALGFILAAGCATSKPGKGVPAANPAPAALAPGALAAASGETPAETAVNTEETTRQALVGAWENGSCAERKYPRTIDFLEDGSFLAFDEVAPCPAGSNCVLPGVINWRGTWRLEGRVIKLEIVPIADAKTPEKTPADFVILGEEPFSIGERSDKLVCPFKKRK